MVLDCSLIFKLHLVKYSIICKVPVRGGNIYVFAMLRMF